MKLARNIALALSLSLAGGATLGGSALAEHGDDYDQDAADDLGRGDGQRWQDDDDRWKDRDDGDGRWKDRDDGDGRWKDRGDGDDWRGRLVGVKFVNKRHQFVTLFLNGRFLARVAPHSRERVWVPAGYHTVTYQVGFRHRFHQLSLTALRGQRNRVVIDGPRWRNWY